MKPIKTPHCGRKKFSIAEGDENNPPREALEQAEKALDIVQEFVNEIRAELAEGVLNPFVFATEVDDQNCGDKGMQMVTFAPAHVLAAQAQALLSELPKELAEDVTKRAAVHHMLQDLGDTLPREAVESLSKMLSQKETIDRSLEGMLDALDTSGKPN